MWAQVGVGLDRLQQLPAVVPRQIQVEQDEVRSRRIRMDTAPVEKIQTFLTVAGDMQSVLDLVVGERFTGYQLVPRIVLDQQDVDHSAG